MSQADSSLHAYALLTQNLTDRQKEVLDRLRFFPDVINMELAVNMGWTVNRITGRGGSCASWAWYSTRGSGRARSREG